jgi:nucleoside-diphosphate-sugar epimerase
MQDRILILGAGGQIGTDLVETLRESYGNSNVIATDLKAPSPAQLEAGPFEQLNALDGEETLRIIKKYGITQVYHLVAMLSATAEKMPMKGWDLNMQSLFNILEMAKDGYLKKVYWPSSIAAFGPTTPKTETPQHTIMDPSTVYGISKLAGELWCKYYFEKFKVDVRGLRYPGLISYKANPGGGTTDYAVDIFHKAVADEDYQCFLGAETTLPMMYMPDAIKATIGIMDAPAKQVKLRTGYNVGAFSFNPQELYQAIQKEKPSFKMTYAVDERDAIAQGWPQSINDNEAKAHWGWQPDYSLDQMVKDMLHQLSARKS